MQRNGVIRNSKVYPVQTISNLKGVGQDNTSAEHGNSGQSHRQTITIRVNPETYADAPADCYTVTYNRVTVSFRHFIIALAMSILTNNGRRKTSLNQNVYC